MFSGEVLLDSFPLYSTERACRFFVAKVLAFPNIKF